MEFIINYWSLIVIAIALVAGAGFAIQRFAKLPLLEQIANLKEWLLWAVTEAETALGGGTGKLKLRYVYDLFVAKFPWLVRVVPFDTFSSLVDEALDEMRDLLEKNTAVKTLVQNGH